MIPATGLPIVKKTKNGRKIAKNKRIGSPLSISCHPNILYYA
jgi:hypothetical protein